ncbi:MAG: hypothetical protein A2X94_06225 [Bdellovibrionales bacterium GWB1_55_8]|nr:MAG: hypothetical protein A2X94_06225 [Bdellovibrionales bacterium GWB1_55_8]
MSRTRKVLLLVSALLAANLANADYRSGEVIVKYREGALRTRTTMNAIYDNVGARKIRRYAGLMKGFEHITLRDGIKVQDAIAELQRSGIVEYAQPNYMLYALPVMNPSEGGIPCIPGFEIPGCEPADGGGGGGGGEVPCLIPGLPFPPGCKDEGGGGGSPWPPGDPGDGDGGGTPPPGNRPELKPAPAEVNPPVADPQLSKAYGIEKVGAIEAWKNWKGSKDMVVAVIDTGVDYNHEDLSFNMWRNPKPGAKNDVVGYDFVHNDGLPYDDNEHGTHCAGSIGGVGGNGIGVSGVSQRVSIMALKFLSGQGSGTSADAIRAIDYAIANGAKVLSNSWGGKGDDENKALYDSIERAKNANVLFIAAAGNDGADNDKPDPSYPAAFDNDNLIAVAATDKNDKMAFFSNYGKKTTHVAAPGASVYSTVPGNKYSSLSGTSMACPHVAGAAALLWSKNPTWSYKKVKQVLMNTVDQLPSLAGKTVTGGRINVNKALQTTD